jgi:hypothetical protein
LSSLEAVPESEINISRHGLELLLYLARVAQSPVHELFDELLQDVEYGVAHTKDLSRYVEVDRWRRDWFVFEVNCYRDTTAWVCQRKGEGVTEVTCERNAELYAAWCEGSVYTARVEEVSVFQPSDLDELAWADADVCSILEADIHAGRGARRRGESEARDHAAACGAHYVGLAVLEV